MWKSETSEHTDFVEPRLQVSPGGSEMPDFEPPDARSFLRRHPGAQQLLESMRGQVGAGGVLLAPDPPSTAVPGTVGDRFTSELETMNRRKRQVREVQQLASHRVVDLTTEQLRRILEFMA